MSTCRGPRSWYNGVVTDTPPPEGSPEPSGDPGPQDAPPSEQMSEPPPGVPIAPPGQAPPSGFEAYSASNPGAGTRSNGKATGALVCGIVGLVALLLCGFVTLFVSPIALFLGRSAQKEIAASPGVYSNAGQAKAGWIMGLIGTVLIAVGIIVFIIVAAAGGFAS